MGLLPPVDMRAVRRTNLLCLEEAATASSGDDGRLGWTIVVGGEGGNKAREGVMQGEGTTQKGNSTGHPKR